ncbi:hypothetical protein ACLPHM_04205 [Paenalcaligenes sp. Me131]|uniref:hypothetical protein n=1 Tax=Paenalcaligenes sp. Me131 TaxID=3392636 RepID=UPI003D2E3898
MRKEKWWKEVWSDWKSEFWFHIAVAIASAAVAGGITSYMLDWPLIFGATWVEVLTALGTVGAVVMSLRLAGIQARKEREEQVKSARRSLAGRQAEVAKLIGDLIRQQRDENDMQRFLRTSQRRIANLLRPTNDLVNKEFNRKLIACADKLGYCLQDYDDGIEVGGERLDCAVTYLRDANKIAKQCWKDMGYYWLGNSHPGPGEHEREINYFEALASEK